MILKHDLSLDKSYRYNTGYPGFQMTIYPYPAGQLKVDIRPNPNFPDFIYLTIIIPSYLRKYMPLLISNRAIQLIGWCSLILDQSSVTWALYLLRTPRSLVLRYGVDFFYSISLHKQEFYKGFMDSYFKSALKCLRPFLVN